MKNYLLSVLVLWLWNLIFMHSHVYKLRLLPSLCYMILRDTIRQENFDAKHQIRRWNRFDMSIVLLDKFWWTNSEFWTKCIYSVEDYLINISVKLLGEVCRQLKWFKPPVVYATDRFKAAVPVLFLFCVTLLFILRSASCLKVLPCSFFLTVSSFL